MIGIGGRFAAAKGMVRVPNLIGLSRAAAQSAIEAAGLVYGGYSDTNVADSGLDDKIANQNILANTLVDYETSISLTRYRYEVPSVPPSYPPKPSDDGQIILGNCVISGGEISYPENEAYCDGTTRVQPAYQVYRRVDKKVTYTEGPSYTWIRSEVSQPSVICNLIFSSNFNTSNSPLCVGCATVVSQNFYSGANSNCTSGFSNYRTDIYTTGCVPANRTYALACIPSLPSGPTLEETILGTCTQVTGTSSSEISTNGGPCLYSGGGIQTRTRKYSDLSTINDTVCCTYVPPAPTCTVSVSYGAYSSCNAIGLSPGTISRVVTTTNADCSQTTVTETATCCAAGCGPFSDWSPSCNGNPPGTQQSRSATCLDSQCNDYPRTETRCCTGTTSTFSECINGRTTRTSITYNSDCTSSTTVTRNVNCLL